MTKLAKRLFKKIYILGNLNIKEDSLPLHLFSDLENSFPDISFIHLDPTEELPEEEELVLIDSVVGLDEVRVLEDIEKIENSPQYSLHDLDLGLSLKLARKLGRIGKVKIICVPAHGEREMVFEEVRKEIRKLI